MSLVLRVEMLVVAIVFVVLVIKVINRKKLRLQYSLVWLLISAGIVLFALLPDIVIGLSEVMGVEVPSNFLYMIALIVLLIITFYLTMIVSKQSEEIKRLIQMTSIEKYLSEERKNSEKTEQ
ncbi:DUF2304 domain-containing protein [[Ruminococcus] torques]|uniref:DUF2304 domain-containing protein n=1 Tax=[Ruminococcus] torques TaxID=33039 RepID=UPI0025A47E09|nr:DUF2304 domain-containing protein [[Ruminococcus] torques]MDM8235023.1 DUF2304 domain-containing protein [[Ruminococcus] torques]